MEETRYVYALKAVDPDQLAGEVAALGLPGYSHVLTSGTIVSVVCADALSASDEARLEAGVLAHRPDPEAPVKRLRAEAKAMARASDPGSVRLRAALKVVLGAIADDRAYLAALRAELVALGRAPPPVPPVRTWAQLLVALDALVDGGQGDA